jgi:hypothetical protein
VAKVARDVLKGLAAAHAKGLIHRDIKPANLWVEKGTNWVKVLDFGLTRPRDEQEPLTHEGQVIGTPAYMAPEQAEGRAVDARAELFSVGVVLHWMLAGRSPFQRDTVMATLSALATVMPASRTVAPGLPGPVADLIDRLLARDPATRPADAGAALAEWQAASASIPPALPVSEVAPLGADPWAGIDDGPTEAAASATPEPKTRPADSHAKKRTPTPLLVGLGLLGLLVVAAAGFIVVKIRNKDGTETEIRVPDGATVTVEKDGKPMAVVGPTPKAEAWKPAPAWKPVAIGASPFDKLEPKEIPTSERFDWQPKELVAVIATHARRVRGLIWAVAVSPDGKLAATVGGDWEQNLVLWDIPTQRRYRSLLNPLEASHSVFTPDGKHLVNDSSRKLAIIDVTGRTDPVVNVIPDGAGLADGWVSSALCEDRGTVIAQSDGADKLVALDISSGKPAAGQVLTTAKGPGSWYGAPFVVATTANRVFYTDPDGRLHRAAVKNARFESDEELPIPLAEKDYPRAVTPDGKTLGLWAGDRLQLWDVSQPAPKKGPDVTIPPGIGADSFGVQSHFHLSPTAGGSRPHITARCSFGSAGPGRTKRLYSTTRAAMGQSSASMRAGRGPSSPITRASSASGT